MGLKFSLLSDLFSFAEVIAAGNFTAAAKKLGRSPSVMSKRIQRLEKTLRVNLLQRTTRDLRLTQIGETCYQEITSLQDQLNTLFNRIDETQQQTQGRLKISAPYAFGQLQLAPVLWHFMQLHPDIDIELLLGETTTRLLQKNIDVGIFTEHVPDSRLIAKKIGKRRTYVCASLNYFEKHHKKIPLTPYDLINHNCLLYKGTNFTDGWDFQKGTKHFSVKVKGNFSANSSQALMQAAVAGLGIVKLPGYVIHQVLKEKKLISMLDDYCPQDIGIFAAYSFTRHPPPRVNALINFLTQQFKNSP